MYMKKNILSGRVVAAVNYVCGDTPNNKQPRSFMHADTGFKHKNHNSQFKYGSIFVIYSL